MKLLLDQDVYAVTGQYLKSLNHDVLRAAEIGLAHSSDEEILRWSRQEGRILITRDKDFYETSAQA